MKCVALVKELADNFAFVVYSLRTGTDRRRWKTNNGTDFSA